jgi:bla regulator protein BlaR1
VIEGIVSPIDNRLKTIGQFAAVSAVCAAGALAQTMPKFEVASIKPADPSVQGMRVNIAPGGRYIANGATVKLLMMQAFGIQAFQIEGGPAWIGNDRFEINAKAESGVQLGQNAIAIIMEGLLYERFHLKISRETKEMPVYALVIAKGGAKVKETDGANNTVSNRRGQMELKGAPMSMFANQLSNLVGRTVLDKTGLTGNYDAKLEFTPDQLQQLGPRDVGGPESSRVDSQGPTIFTSIQEQLGLRLEATKGPVAMYVVQKVERPTEN